jgi:hypothetical protein
MDSSGTQICELKVQLYSPNHLAIDVCRLRDIYANFGIMNSGPIQLYDFSRKNFGKTNFRHYNFRHETRHDNFRHVTLATFVSINI